MSTKPKRCSSDKLNIIKSNEEKQFGKPIVVMNHRGLIWWLVGQCTKQMHNVHKGFLKAYCGIKTGRVTLGICGLKTFGSVSVYRMICDKSSKNRDKKLCDRISMSMRITLYIYTKKKTLIAWFFFVVI